MCFCQSVQWFTCRVLQCRNPWWFELLGSFGSLLQFAYYLHEIHIHAQQYSCKMLDMADKANSLSMKYFLKYCKTSQFLRGFFFSVKANTLRSCTQNIEWTKVQKGKTVFRSASHLFLFTSNLNYCLAAEQNKCIRARQQLQGVFDKMQNRYIRVR